jgi:nucleotide-binding universal stress UspA family protein
VVNELMRAVSALRADMLVAGAYGHSRLQELVLGGVTEQLLRKPACFVLMAH